MLSVVLNPSKSNENREFPTAVLERNLGGRYLYDIANYEEEHVDGYHHHLNQLHSALKWDYENNEKLATLRLYS